MSEEVPLADGNGGAGRAPGQPDLMAVQGPVVREVLIERLFSDMVDRDATQLPAQVVLALEHAPAVILGEDRAGRLSASVNTLARRLARLGYLARMVEQERFERAQAPSPELAAELRQRAATSGKGALGAAQELAGELARREPGERPDPDDERAASWRIPGPGGHVRHFLAAHSASVELDKHHRMDELPPGISRTAELKRFWMYGFFLHCCDEAVPGGESG